ncbi:T9SS type A sorting domain-containing protein, partial [Bacteroidota bacterium]
SFVSDYTVDENKKPELIITPEDISFDNVTIGSSESMTITLQAKNNNVEIDGINFLSDVNASGRLVINWGPDAPPPIFIEKDSSYGIIIEYSPIDTLGSEATIEFYGTACSGREMTLTANPAITSVEGDYLNSLEYGLISLYPNPANEKITISLPEIPNDDGIIDKQTFLFIYDYMGNKVKEYEINSAERLITLNIENLKNGSYFIKCTRRYINGVVPFVVYR